ncbi:MULTISPECIES: T9SS type A sorting domain-containing protein [unclassified Tenacibaculum]|uniref:T9SS type A sorting domain-containing protein n=1 Tax=unclassified Tenacibaculum TaxID=2635139 RepID=UPI001F32B446|nr:MULTISPECIES: T9SS type A sorting domain-containing protein [unclassified Tenacibaculum]MCF2876189.1 T9SS type A sorting domain-containing protein [Tenacibaculum sp. Cn5-1]MCF2936264.1 T9SS type A sorting domain-containing protein [Tenacibaculum sp. Cn5-34]MCG7511607.1 T9SS type A sorting domain-containing protein [Tenacibaculum sp. Cn5-46]
MLNKKTLRITGIPKGETKVFVFDSLGKEIIKARTKFKGKGFNTIKLPVLERGEYIVRLKTEDGAFIKRSIVLE